jgi:hypothetical protein
MVANLLRALFRAFGERAYFFGDNRKAAAVLAGSCRLDRRVERQQIRLVGNLADRLGNLANILSAPSKFRYQRQRSLLALGIPLDPAHRARDLHCGVAEDGLHRFGPPMRAFRLGPSHPEIGDDAFQRLQLLARRTGGFVGTAGNLLHRAAQLFRGRSRLGKPACQLFGRRRYPFGGLRTPRPGGLARLYPQRRISDNFWFAPVGPRRLGNTRNARGLNESHQ